MGLYGLDNFYNMNKILISLFLSVASLSAYSQDNISNVVVFEFMSGSITQSHIKSKMESSTTTLLTRINDACINDTQITLEGVSIENNAAENLSSLWGNIHFYCEDAVCIEPCLVDVQGYQVRGIPITLKPLSDDFEGTLERELTISYNKSGTITGVRMAIENNQISDIMKTGSAVTDTRRRLEILKFVEDFRCYYNEKNLEALEKVYADDALIITGSVLKNLPNTDMMPQVKYRKYDKKQYMNSLKGIFARNKYVDIKFDKISVVRHGAKPDFYGVTLYQDWNTSTYSDKGWLFLLWDFRDELHPVIHVRTWQPHQIIQTENDVFSLDDFFIP